MGIGTVVAGRLVEWVKLSPRYLLPLTFYRLRSVCAPEMVVYIRYCRLGLRLPTLVGDGFPALDRVASKRGDHGRVGGGEAEAGRV